MSQTRLCVVICGAIGTLGSAVVRAFAARRAAIGMIDIVKEAPALHLQLQHDHAYELGIDLTDFRSTNAAMQRCAQALGGIDVLVNVAGGFCWEPLESGDVGTWDRMYQMNLKSALNASKAALPEILRSGSRGRIINIGAAAAAKAAAGMGAYAASKSAIQRLTESLSEELKDRGVTVNAILPGIIDTPRNRADMPNADRARWVAAGDIAEIIVFLASERARAVSGASIPVLGTGPG